MQSTQKQAQENYLFKNVCLGGGGFVSGIITNETEADLIYVRTDVGGAYRWLAESESWKPLLDWLGPENWNYQGVESLASDPKDPRRVYVAAGTYQSEAVGNGAILYSEDYGESWGICPLPFKMGANEAGRGSGERLAINPQNSAHILLGSRKNGLWESRDYGKSWSQVPGFPQVEDGSAGQVQDPSHGKWNYLAQAVGIVQVLFDSSSQDPNRQRVWAAVSRHYESLFVSEDSGKTWKIVPNQPQGLRPTCMDLSSDGHLYISYSMDPGPNTMAPGALWSYDAAKEQWSNVSPEKNASGLCDFGCASVSCDRKNPKRLICSSWHRGPFDEIFISENRGIEWKAVLKHAHWNHKGVRYSEHLQHHWLSDAVINPHRPQEIFFNTGYGLWHCKDLSESERSSGAAEWIFENRGLEETVPLCLLSPATSALKPRLISGLGDIDGFVHYDLDSSPSQGSFDKPGYKNTEILAAAGLDPQKLVRCGTTYKHDKIHGAFSKDGGLHWEALNTQPPETAETSHPSSAGSIAINADGTCIVWCPKGNKAWRTTDEGWNWALCEGLEASVQVLADPLEASIFYAWDTLKGTILISRDCGKTFEVQSSGFAIPPKPWGPLMGNMQSLPGKQGSLLALYNEILYLSEDEGLHFMALAPSKVRVFGSGCACEGGDFPSLYIQGTLNNEQGLFRSDDKGLSWVRINSEAQGFPTLNIICGDTCIPKRLYLGTGGRGIFYGEPYESRN